MGATFSYLGYASYRQPYPPHNHGSQQLHQSFGPTFILGNGDTASPSMVNLCIRLAALENILQVIRAEILCQEAISRHLLQINVNDMRIKDITAKLNEQLSLLKKAIYRTENENKEIKCKLRIAEDTILTLSTSCVVNARPQSTSTSLNSCGESQPQSEVVTEDLIDLLSCSPNPDGAKSIDDNTTLLDRCCEDELDVGEVVESTTPNQSLHQSSDSKLEDFTYIVHFADSVEHAKSQDAIKISSEVLCPLGLVLLPLLTGILNRRTGCFARRQSLCCLYSSRSTFLCFLARLMQVKYPTWTRAIWLSHLGQPPGSLRNLKICRLRLRTIAPSHVGTQKKSFTLRKSARPPP